MKALWLVKKWFKRAEFSGAACVLIMTLSPGCGMLRTAPAEFPAIAPRWSSISYPVDGSTVAQSPTCDASVHFCQQESVVPKKPLPDFWASLGDSDLPRVLQSALRQNDTLQLSQLQLKLSQLQAALSGLSLLPTPSVSLNAAISRPMSSGKIPATTYRSAGLNAALRYPLDIWGSARAQRNAAKLDASASEDDWRAARLAICVLVTQARWQIGYLNRLIENTQADLQDASYTLSLANARYQAGATSRADVLFAQRQLADQRTVLSVLQQQRAESRHAFSVLMGHPPQAQQAELTSLNETSLPTPAVGLPADLLSRRADVHAAELRVRSSLATAESIRLSFYPSLSLTASYGTSSPSLTHYLADPIGSLAALLTLPIVEFNTARYTQQTAEVVYQASAVNFKKTLYQALVETEDALSARQHLAWEAQEFAEVLMLSQALERLTLARWQQGASDIQPWLEAKRARRQATLSALQNLLARKNNAIELYAALGGDYADPASAPLPDTDLAKKRTAED